MIKSILFFALFSKMAFSKNELLALKNLYKFNFNAINETSGVKKSIHFILMHDVQHIACFETRNKIRRTSHLFGNSIKTTTHSLWAIVERIFWKLNPDENSWHIPFAQNLCLFFVSRKRGLKILSINSYSHQFGLAWFSSRWARFIENIELSKHLWDQNRVC